MPIFREQATPRSRLLVWCTGIACALAISAASWYVAERAVERDANNRFQSLAAATTSAIGARVKSYTDALRGVVALLQTGDELGQAQFERYVAGLDVPAHFPAVCALNYARYSAAGVPGKAGPTASAAAAGVPGKAGPTASAAAAGVPGKAGPTGSAAAAGVPGKAGPTGSAAGGRFIVVHAVSFVHPMETVGTDLGASGELRAALAHARDTGSIAVSSQPVRHGGAAGEAAMVMRMPVYRPGRPLTSAAERRAAYLGAVGAGINLPTLIRGTLDEGALPNVHFMLFDSGLSGASGRTELSRSDRLIYDNSRHRGHFPVVKVRSVLSVDKEYFAAVLPIDFNGRLWKTHFAVEKAALYTEFDKLFPWIAACGSLLGTLLIYGLFYSLSSSRRRAIALARAMTAELRASETQLLESHRKLRQLAAHTEQIKEDERKRIAREIHDDLGQNLLALRIDVVMLAARTEPHHPKLNAKVRSTLAQIDATIRSVRQIINDLRPNVLDLGLNAAVEWQVTQFQQRTGIRCELRENQADIELDDKSATALFRILQESLNNISKHAKASHVTVELSQHADHISMAISDNGVGMLINSRQKAGSFGLIGIEERVSLLGGQLHIESSPGAGVTILVTVPLTRPQLVDAFVGERI